MRQGIGVAARVEEDQEPNVIKYEDLAQSHKKSFGIQIYSIFIFSLKENHSQIYRRRNVWPTSNNERMESDVIS